MIETSVVMLLKNICLIQSLQGVTGQTFVWQLNKMFIIGTYLQEEKKPKIHCSQLVEKYMVFHFTIIDWIQMLATHWNHRAEQNISLEINSLVENILGVGVLWNCG